MYRFPFFILILIVLPVAGLRADFTPSNPASDRSADPLAEPDWKARYDQWLAHYRSSYEPVKVSRPITVTLKSGATKSGLLASVNKTQLEIYIDGNIFPYPKESLSNRDRLIYFEDDFTLYHANLKIQEEKKRYAARVRKARLEEEARNKPAPPPARPDRPIIVEGPAYEPSLYNGKAVYSKPPVNHPKDASVWQVKYYLTNKLRNADTIRYQEWSRVVKHDDGYSVRCKYTVDTESFGRIIENKVFYMSPLGRVVRTAAGTQTL